MNTESSKQYTARILGYLGKKDPLVILSGTPKKIKEIISSTSKRNLSRKPNPHTWSIREIIAHLAETELVLGWRYRSIAEKNGVAIQSFDQDVWSSNSDYKSLSIQDSELLFRTLRNANIRFLKGLSKRKLSFFGVHAERGKESIEQIIRLEAGHDLNHLMQIAKIQKK